LIDVAQIGQRHGEVREHRSVGIFGQSRTDAAMRRISKAMTLIQERAGGNELPEMEAGQPICAATPQLRANIVPRLGDFFDLLGKRQR
jgi:hypothetical protein